MEKSSVTDKTMKFVKIVIAGRPNVGKSTLFNRLTGRKSALVDPTPGVTRDSKLVRAEIGGLPFDLIDTAGLELGEDGIAGRLNELAEDAIEEADAVLFMIDGKDGITTMDESIAAYLRTSGKPIVSIINKSDVHSSDDVVYEFYSLGLEGEPLHISAEHGRGLDELAMVMQPIINEKTVEVVEDDTPKPLPLAIIGRPNAGKSTLVNTLLKKKRMLTGPEAGLTRENVATVWEHDGQLYELVDTAGVRKKAKVNEELEQMSVTNSMKAIASSEAVILMLDATMPFEKQDAILASRAVEQGKPLVIGLNKWDLVKDKEKCLKEVKFKLEHSLSQIKGVPFVPLSALKGKHVEKLLPEILRLHELWQTRLSTGKLNRFLTGMLEANPPPMRRNRRLKIKYMSQVDSEPPTFAIMCNMADQMPESYIRYLINGMREAFDLYGVVIRMHPRSTKNPYVTER